MNVVMSLRLFTLSLVFMFAAVMCQPAFADQKPSDDQIHDDVLQKLAADRDVKGGGIDVEVKDGVVTLRGKVLEAKQKERAEHLTKKVKGVKSVVNQLQVETPETPHAAK